MSAPAIRVEGLTRRFGRRWALRGVDLEIERGSVVALLGANGTGKTTLLRILSTLLRPTAGEASVLGLDLASDADAIRRRTALMTPTGHVYDELTGVENLRFAARMGEVTASDDDLRAALARVDLADAADLAVRGYSTGMRKRLELARLGLRAPDVVLLDEPFTSLDSTGVDLVQDAIAAWRAAGATVVIASHRTAETGRHADRTVRLARGVIDEAASAP
ncbi:MAG: heme ABC exporter ATP-binding protein CcmA [Gemmatimonadota bacterium]|nr:heme ABC exporter ATP-binding protein CcmA [Gemmatimonadota bacterium]